MGYQTLQDVARAVWALARSQHFVVSRAQLIELGVHPQAIKHRVASGRLHPVHRGVYAVGRRELTRYGGLMSAVLASGDRAVLSHRSAAGLWGATLASSWRPTACATTVRQHSRPARTCATKRTPRPAAGLLPLRFTHGQVAYDRSYVIATLRKVTAQRSRRANPARAAKPSSPT